MDYAHLVWTDDVIGRHAVMNAAGRCVQHDVVAELNISERPEKRVAMSRDGDVARLARQRRAFDVSEALAQRLFFFSLYGDHREANSWNRQLGERRSIFRDRQRPVR